MHKFLFVVVFTLNSTIVSAQSGSISASFNDGIVNISAHTEKQLCIQGDTISIKYEVQNLSTKSIYILDFEYGYSTVTMINKCISNIELGASWLGKVGFAYSYYFDLINLAPNEEYIFDFKLCFIEHEDSDCSIKKQLENIIEGESRFVRFRPAYLSDLSKYKDQIKEKCFRLEWKTDTEIIEFEMGLNRIVLPSLEFNVLPKS